MVRFIFIQCINRFNFIPYFLQGYFLFQSPHHGNPIELGTSRGKEFKGDKSEGGKVFAICDDDLEIQGHFPEIINELGIDERGHVEGDDGKVFG